MVLLLVEFLVLILANAAPGTKLPSLATCEALLFDRATKVKETLRPLVQLPLALAGRDDAAILLHHRFDRDAAPYHAPLRLTVDAPDLYLHDFMITTADGQYSVLQGAAEDLIDHARFLLSTADADRFSFEVLDQSVAEGWDQSTATVRLNRSIRATTHEIVKVLDLHKIDGLNVYDSERDTVLRAIRRPELLDDLGLESLGIRVQKRFDAADFSSGAHAWHEGPLTLLSDAAFAKLLDLEDAVANPTPSLGAKFARALGLDGRGPCRYVFVPAPPPEMPTPNPEPEPEPVIMIAGAQPASNVHVLQVVPTPGRIMEGVRSLDELEREAIEKAVIYHGGHMSRVAESLKMGRSTLYRKLKEYDLVHLKPRKARKPRGPRLRRRLDAAE